MKIGGFQTCSLCDYPGKISAVVFTQGCNFRCPFCHNGNLIPSDVEDNRLVPVEEVLARLNHRIGQIDGVVISGGEPTLHKDLDRFLHSVKQMGFTIKLDTNGSRPDVLRRLLDGHLLDYVAMDVKAPWDKYGTLSGISQPNLRRIAESMQLIAGSHVPHEFRTTVVDALLTAEDLVAMRGMIPRNSPWKLQSFRPEHALDPGLTAPPRIYELDAVDFALGFLFEPN